MSLSDLASRKAALNPENAYIVQAPAGSGKTELLTQRFLALLSRLDYPEEIIALTFTRKAASEMQSRILLALEKAQCNPMPTVLHEQVTWQLARNALIQNEKKQWHLLETPLRLKIQTLDALNHALASQMPILSQGIEKTKIAHDPGSYYTLAAQNLIREGLTDPNLRSSLKTLLLHVGNHQERLIELFASLLSHRDQWLPYLDKDPNLKARLEAGLRHILEDLVTILTHTYPKAFQSELEDLIAFAAPNLEGTPLAKHLTSPLPYLKWQGIAAWLLTEDNTFRKRITQKEGFPAPTSVKDPNTKACYTSMKQKMQDLLETLSQEEPLRLALENIRWAPDPLYSDKQWAVIAALTEVLPMLAAHLRWIFTQKGSVDFIAVAGGASEALGALDAPSDLALYLDYKIQHLLIDEFQDTSIAQFHLLQKLTAGWQLGDGRTLFIVGDPMQSIYRFRQADVSIFLQVKEEGWGALPLTFLKLSSNFRSDPKIVEWINQSFSTIFPKKDNLALSEISYHPSEAAKKAQEAEITFHECGNRAEEASEIVKLIQSKPSSEKIALLVRSRDQLTALLPALQKSGISFQGVEIDKLDTHPVILDLSALTQAILQPYHRLAWLSILRTPWCGVTLPELHALAQHETLLFAMKDPGSLGLSESTALRVQHVYHVLREAISEKDRLPFADTVEKTWRALGGHLCVPEIEKQNIQRFFEILSEYEPHVLINQFNLFLKRMRQHFASQETHASLHVMTIHKAKGLEFDTIILPHLESSHSPPKQPLLRWMEHTRQDSSSLILAPLKAIDETQDPIYRYLSYLDRKKSAFEEARLLYVALTRAQSNIHLFASTHTPLMKGSFLKRLAATLPTPIIGTTPLPLSDPTPTQSFLKRLPLCYFEKSYPQAFNLYDTLKSEQPYPLEHGDFMRPLGIFIHSEIKRCLDQNITDLTQLQKEHWSRRLSALGILDEKIEEAVELTQQALHNLYEDPQGRFIMASHPNGQSEYKLSVYERGETKQYILDRTFIDPETHKRWIIDFKITKKSLPQGTLSMEYCEEAYQKQLEHYAEILAQYTREESLHLGLYYPLSRSFIPWVFSVSNQIK